MSLISKTSISDGTTIDAADVNAPLDTIYNDYNGNIDGNNLADNLTMANLTISNTLTVPTAVNPVTRLDETTYDFVASGLIWTADSAGSTRNGSMTAGIAYINGQRLVVGLVAAHVFTASKDTYIDILNTAGAASVAYTEVANNAASPDLAANSIRIGIVVTGATTIAAAASINQGQEDRVLPIASSIPYAVTDSLGNLICPRDPSRRILGYRQLIADYSAGTNVVGDVPGLAVPFIAMDGRKVKATISNSANMTAGSRNTYTYLKEGATTLAQTWYYFSGAVTNRVPPTEYDTTPTAGLHTWKVSMACDAGSNWSAIAQPSFIRIELV